MVNDPVLVPVPAERVTLFAPMTLEMNVLAGRPRPLTIRPRSLAANTLVVATSEVPTRVPDAFTAGLSDEMVALVATLATPPTVRPTSPATNVYDVDDRLLFAGVVERVKRPPCDAVAAVNVRDTKAKSAELRYGLEMLNICGCSALTPHTAATPNWLPFPSNDGTTRHG